MTGVDSLILMAALLVVAGAVTGILAGLFGVGGGTIMVPILFYCFGRLGVADSVAMPLAVGSSLAIIIPTSIKSARGHIAKGAADLALVKSWGVAIVLGVLVGAAIARFAPPIIFQAVFVAVASANAVKLLSGRSDWQIANALPGGLLRQAYGAVIGLISALMGIGGGVISNLIMILYGKPIHAAVATSAVLGMLISLPGTLGYVWAGWAKEGLPPYSIGFVSLPAFALLVPLALLTTGVGVKLAHALSKRQLEIAFGLYLLVVSGRFVLKWLGLA